MSSLRPQPFLSVVILVLFLVCVGSNLPISHAAFTTNITSDGTLPTPTTVTPNGKTYDINGGTIKGTNQFHSFGKFNIGTGDTASFNGPAGILNILSRVTGGQSQIDGTIKSTISGANLYLMNPAGVLFGPNATLNLSGSFHVTTADYLRHTDNVRFSAVSGAQDALLSTAPVAAFGFTATKPVAITVQGTILEVPFQRELSVIGGDFTLTGGTLRSAGGRIQIASVASSGEVIPSAAGQPLALDVSSFTQLGSVTESASSNLSVSAPTTTSTIGAGTVLIRANQLTVDSSGINATTAVTNGASVGIDLNVTQKIFLTNSTAQTAANGAGRGGDIRIQTDTLQINNANILGRALSGTGDGGAIDVNARLVDLRNRGGIQTFTNAGGRAGNITLRADRLEMRDAGNIFSGGLGTGPGGNIDVVVKEFFGSATNLASVPNCAACITGISAQAGFGSPGGSVRVHADNIQLFDGAAIRSDLFSIGPGANIEVTAKDILLSGAITVTGSSGPVTQFAVIGSIVSGTFAQGTGGNVTVNAENIEIANNGRIISVDTFGAPGNAGNTVVNTDTLNIHDRGGVFATSFLGTGNSGNIDITAKSITISGVRNSLNPGSTADFTGLSGSTLSGRGGILHVTTDDLFVRDKGIIASTTFGTGNSGNIQIAAKNVSVTDAAQITAVTGGAGRGGSIDIIADNVTVSGQVLVPGALDPGLAVITAQSIAAGNAGSITIAAKQLDVSNGGAINNDARGTGKGGSIIITGSSAIIDGGSITTKTTGPGAAGSIAMQMEMLQLTNGATISAASSGTGDAGNIGMAATDRLVMTGSAVTTQATQADGGNITIQAGNLIHLVGSNVTTSVGTGFGNGGNISIDPNFVVLDHSHIVANAFGGKGGNITITAGVFLADPSSIVNASSARGINGTIDIQSPVQNLSGTLSPLPATLLKIAPLTSQCAARAQGGTFSSFTVAGRDGVPVEPGGLLPSPLQEASQSVTSSTHASSDDAGLPISILLAMNWEGYCGQ